MRIFKPDVEKMEAEKNVKRLLLTLKYDEDDDVRYRTAEALRKIGWQPKNDEEKVLYDRFLVKNKEWKESIMFRKPEAKETETKSEFHKGEEVLIGELESEAVEPHIQALKDEYKHVRQIKNSGEKCKYTFENGLKCEEKAEQKSEYCILHLDFPENEESLDFFKIKELKENEVMKLKEKKVEEKIKKGDFNFEGVKIIKVDFPKMNIIGNINFRNASILSALVLDSIRFNRKLNGNIMLNGARIRGLYLSKSEIKGNVELRNAKIKGEFRFDEAKIIGNISGDNSEIEDILIFDKAEIDGSLSFVMSKLDTVIFTSATINGDVNFSAAEISKDFFFPWVTIGGDFLVEGTKIKKSATPFNKAEVKGNLIQGEFKVQREGVCQGCGNSSVRSAVTLWLSCPECGMYLGVPQNSIDKQIGVNVACNKCSHILKVPPEVWCSVCKQNLLSNAEQIIKDYNS